MLLQLPGQLAQRLFPASEGVVPTSAWPVARVVAAEAFLKLLDRYFTARELSADWQTLQEAENELLINSLSMLLDFEPEDKQALLEAPSLSTRRETLVTLIEYALRGGDDEEIMQ